MGQISQFVGKEFETSIRHKLTILKQQAVITWWQHNEPGWRRTGPVYRPCTPSGADFVFQLTGSGLGCVMEAKSVGPDKKTGKIGEFVRETRIPDTQLHQLEATANTGALSLLLLQFRPNADAWRTFAIPWFSVPWRKRKVNHSVAMADLSEFLVSPESLIVDRFVQRDNDGYFWPTSKYWGAA